MVAAGTTVSVVLPVYNEAENLDLLVGRLTEVLERASAGDFEVLFVDDGSTDASPEMLDALAARDPRCKVIHFSRNFGHQAALQAGLDGPPTSSWHASSPSSATSSAT